MQPKIEGTFTLPPVKLRVRKRLLRIVLSLLVTTAVGLVLAYLFAAEAEETYRSRVAQLSATEPVTVSDVCHFGGIPDDQNAAIPLKAAAALVPDIVRDPDEFRRILDYPFVVPLTDVERQYARDSAGPFDRIEPLVREASHRRSAHWPHQITGLLLNADFPELRRQRALAQAIDYTLLLATDRGDYSAAFDGVPLLLTVSKGLRGHPSIVGFLVSAGIEHMALGRLEDIAARMSIGEAPGQVSAARVRQMIAALADDDGLTSSLQHALRGDRAQTLQLLEMVGKGQSPDGSKVSFLGRLSLLSQRASFWHACDDALDIYGQMIAAVDESNWPTADVKTPTGPSQGIPTAANTVLTNLLPSLSRTGLQHYKLLTQRRLARTGLALRLYSAEHRGLLPDRLDDLVPQYLDVVPIDALSAGSPVRYRSGTDPVIYSVGENGVDDGGSPPLHSAFRLDELANPRNRPVGGDVPYFLTPRPRPIVEESEAQ